MTGPVAGAGSPVPAGGGCPGTSIGTSPSAPPDGRVVAAIDCGTNSLRLLISRVVGGPPEHGGRLAELYRGSRVVRLGQGVDRTGLLAPAAIERTRVGLADYAELIAEHRVDQVRMVATSAARDAGNADQFQAMVAQTLGVVPEVITGTEEAELSFAGAVAGLAPMPDPVLVADIGGGSTELVLGSCATGQITSAHSMNVGCVRLTERHLHSDPPAPEQILAAAADLTAALTEAGRSVALTDAACLVGVAGTVTTLAAIGLRLPEYDPLTVHGARLSYEQVRRISEELLAMTTAERVDIPVMDAGRADVIAAGALVATTIMEYAGLGEVIVSEHDILDGLVMSIASA